MLCWLSSFSLVDNDDVLFGGTVNAPAVRSVGMATTFAGLRRGSLRSIAIAAIGDAGEARASSGRA